MNRGVYTLALRAASPLVWLWMAHRARRAGGQWRFLRRTFRPWRNAAGLVRRACLGACRQPGETRAAQPLLQALLDRGLPVLLTHITATDGRKASACSPTPSRAASCARPGCPTTFPAPPAVSWRWRPLRLLIEREIWPNLLAAARAQRVPMGLVSARYSESSLRQAAAWAR